MSYGGGGPQPVKIPDRQHSEPRRRVPDQPPGGGRLFWEQVVKWGSIAVVLFFLGTAMLWIATCEREPTQREARATAEAASATREAVQQRVNPD